jgi:LPS export ABC transporter protein LptC
MVSTGILVLQACDSGRPPEPLVAVSSQTAATPPSQILRNFEMQDMQAGVKSMSLVSVEGRIFEQTQTAEVEKPLVTFYKLGAVSSVMNAPKGLVNMQTHDMDAWGGVTVVNTDSSTLTSERLHYDSKRQKILTSDPVRLDKPDSVTDGIGMEADPDLKDVKIGQQTVHMKKSKKG